MRQRLSLFGLLAVLSAHGAHVHVDFADFGLTSLTNRSATLTLQGTNVLNGQLISREAKQRKTETTGQTVFSNAIAGLYKLELASTPPSIWWLNVPDTNGVVVAADFVVASTNAPGNVVAYSQAQANARFLTIPTNAATASDGDVVSKTGDKTKYVAQGSGGSATNVNFIDSATVTHTTVAGSNQFNVVGSALTGIPQAGVSGLPAALAAATSGNFTNLAELIASPLTNRVAYVQGYWGTNIWGGGWFRHHTNAATTNLGTVFLSAHGGYWHRQWPRTNEFYLEWFGITPINTDDPTTRRDSYREITNCFAVAGNNSTVIFPPFGIFTTQDIIQTNWIGRTLKGSGVVGSRLVYPERASWLAYQGPGGTNSVILRLWNPHTCVIDGIGFETSTPVPTGIGYYPTNNAQVGLDIDQFSGGGQIATDNVIKNCTFRSRGTNVFWQGYRISYSSPNNCEGFTHENLHFLGNGNVDFSASGNAGHGILIGRSANARAHTFRHIMWSGVTVGLTCSNGGFTLQNGLGTGTTTDFILHSWVAPVKISDFFTENGRQAFLIGSGAGMSGGTLPLTIENYHNTSSTSGPNGDTNTPLIQVYGSAQLNVMHSDFAAHTNQLIYWVTNTATAVLRSVGNHYGPVPLNWERTGFGQFSAGESVGDLPIVNQARSFRWGGSGTSGYVFDILDRDGNTNRTIFKTEAGSVRFVPAGVQRSVFGGPLPSTLAQYALAVHATNTPTGLIVFGDPSIPERLTLGNDGNSSDNTLALNATNNRGVRIKLKEGSGNDELHIVTGFGRHEIYFIGAPFRLLSGGGFGNGVPVFTISENTTTTFISTNPTAGLTLQTEQTVVTGRVDIAKSLLIRSNTLANWPAAPSAAGAFALVNSNGVALLLESDTGNAWTRTNKLSLTLWAQIAALVTGTPDGSKFLRDDGTWQAIPGGGDALTSNPLSQFAATTSAQLRGVLSDETGTGASVFVDGNIGAATATTPSADDNDTSVATTAYVQTELTAYDSDTRTFTGKTFDAAATGNELNFKGYLALRGFDNATGALPVNTNDFTANTFMQPVFLNGTDKASNFIEWRTSVPDDLDTATPLRARVKFKLTAADTGSHRYVLSFASVAASGAYAGTPSTEINLDFAGDASGASGDFEQVGFTTLTDWAASLTAGDLWVIRLARDGDTSDTSTVNSAFCELTIEYGVSQ